MMLDHEALRTADPSDIRTAIRNGSYSGHTAGLAPDRLQVNLAIMAEEFALDFARFCQRNPKPCPLVGVSDTGERVLHTLGHDLRVDTDAPGYCVYHNGVLQQQPTDISDIWQDDFVTFALGCSFTFEHALAKAGIAMRHIDQNRTVPMYRTSLDLVPAGPFGGGMVVSMRPLLPQDIERVRSICAEFPLAHGAPVHVGDPSEIGITDINAPEWGDAVDIRDGEVCVFWACGVTPQNAAIRAQLPVFLSHRPGAMLITDVDERANPPVLQD
ncbi:putative hydro-lyase [uncultured Tateyamaria sp.]|uniref:putative hydro-lyase n=1 Tax=uncultured Tateyamaria sp. TaxID=455651 RepID=UPI002631BADC|nr:putative hydro-lyase [uncultured Tateyamaria sp.]